MEVDHDVLGLQQEQSYDLDTGEQTTIVNIFLFICDKNLQSPSGLGVPLYRYEGAPGPPVFL